MPLHCFSILQGPESGSDTLFFWDTVFIEKLPRDFPHILRSALPVMYGWAGPLQMLGEKPRRTSGPNTTPADLLLNCFPNFAI